MNQAKRILVCDDNDDILDLIGHVLGGEGYDVGSAHGFKELDRLLGSNPDLLILDIRMPEMDGFDIIEALQKKGSKVPVLLMTAHDHFMYRNYAPVMGVRDYMPKPFEPHTLLEKVAGILMAEQRR